MRLTMLFIGLFLLFLQFSNLLCKNTKFVEFILDASGSMNGHLDDGTVKMDAARQAITDLLQSLPDDIQIAFRVYGHQFDRKQNECQDTELLFRFDRISKIRNLIIEKAKALKPKGYTPITWTLQQAIADFPDKDNDIEPVLILISDGKETCAGDPCSLAHELARRSVNLVIHTLGLDADAATRGQLKCIARATGGQYFHASNSQELLVFLKQAIEVKANPSVDQAGNGWLSIDGADMRGHKVIRASNGKQVGQISQMNSTIELPVGLYHVIIGNTVWKSVEVLAEEKTILTPGWLTVDNASVHGHKILERESGQVYGSISNVEGPITLIPGEYDVMFFTVAWPICLKTGQRIVLKPGKVQVLNADEKGHTIYDKNGDIITSVNHVMNWVPLPPGEYAIEINHKQIPFSLDEAENLEFQTSQ